jgi:hypothetical protein
MLGPDAGAPTHTHTSARVRTDGRTHAWARHKCSELGAQKDNAYTSMRAQELVLGQKRAYVVGVRIGNPYINGEIFISIHSHIQLSPHY